MHAELNNISRLTAIGTNYTDGHADLHKVLSPTLGLETFDISSIQDSSITNVMSH